MTQHKSHPTTYSGVNFRSRLEARWAAFFDLAKWQWEYEPYDLRGWTPDFRVEFFCGHSECHGSHSLLVEVKPYRSIDEFSSHFSWRYVHFGSRYDEITGLLTEDTIDEDGSAMFGINPDVTYWCIVHGAGGGEENVHSRVDNANELWKTAGNLVQWMPRVNIPPAIKRANDAAVEWKLRHERRKWRRNK